MEFFDILGKKASEAYKMTADKTGKIAKETKLRFKMNELKSQVEDIYIEIGKKVYEKHIREEEICIKSDLEEQCTKIDVLSDEIEQILKECLELKDQKQCQNCSTQIQKDSRFCPNCGQEQSENEVNHDKIEKEEQTENQANQDSQNKMQAEQETDEEIEKMINDELESMESNSQTEENQTNLEKTVAIESNVELEEDEEE